MRSIVVSIIALIALAGILPAGVVSDVKVSGGYLFVASTDRTEIYDLTVDPKIKISEITYPESTVPINIEVSGKDLFVYHYQYYKDNGIYYYDLRQQQLPVLAYDIVMDYLIEGGFIGTREKLDNYTPGKMMLDGNKLYFTYYIKGASYQPYYYYYFSINDNTIYPFNAVNDHSCSIMLPLLNNVFFAKSNNNFFIIQDAIAAKILNGFVSTSIANLDDDPICFKPIGAGYLEECYFGGPLRFLDGYGVVRGLCGYESQWTINYSGIVFKDLSLWEYSTQFISDYTCTYPEKHGGNDSGVTYDNAYYDVQDILVKEREIYLSSYISKSIPHVDYDEMDFAHDYINCEPYWEFYDLPTHPYGMAAANGTLYVAAEDKVYEFPLVHPDPDLPRGEILHAANDGTTLILSGWAKDPEGIRNVFVRLDNAYQFTAEKDQGEGHIRPMDLRYDWKLSISLDAIDPGDYDVKVIAEDRDGDFSVIGSFVLNRESDAAIAGRQMLSKR